MTKLTKYKEGAQEFVVYPEPSNDWIDTFMGGVLTLGVCGSVTLGVLIILKTLLNILTGAGQ
tara:strand:- start:8262 stop:8447 length:186 start_codon:yes stop_codon:yes gene_type:complete